MLNRRKLLAALLAAPFLAPIAKMFAAIKPRILIDWAKGSDRTGWQWASRRVDSDARPCLTCGKPMRFVRHTITDDELRARGVDMPPPDPNPKYPVEYWAARNPTTINFERGCDCPDTPYVLHRHDPFGPTLYLDDLVGRKRCACGAAIDMEAWRLIHKTTPPPTAGAANLDDALRSAINGLVMVGPLPGKFMDFHSDVERWFFWKFLVDDEYAIRRAHAAFPQHTALHKPVYPWWKRPDGTPAFPSGAA